MHTYHSHENPSSESLHETSQAIVAAAMGIKEISVITSTGKRRASVNDGKLWAQLVTSFAGCAGDRIISGLPDEVCKQRSTSDRKIRESMRAHVRKDLDWTELCQRADNLAGDLTDALRLQIIEFASVLETFVIARLDFPAEQVETLPCVQEARSQEKLAGLQPQPPRIESSLRLST